MNTGWSLYYNPILQNVEDTHRNLILAVEKIITGQKTEGVKVEGLKVVGSREQFVLNIYGNKYLVERVADEETYEKDYIFVFLKEKIMYIVSHFA